MGEGKNPYAVKTGWEMETKLYLFLTFAVDGIKWLILHPAHFTPAENP